MLSPISTDVKRLAAFSRSMLNAVQIVEHINEVLEQLGYIPRRLHRLLLELLGTLFLDHGHNDPEVDAGCLLMLEHEERIVPQKGLLAGSLSDALSAASVATSSYESTAANPSAHTASKMQDAHLGCV